MGIMDIYEVELCRRGRWEQHYARFVAAGDGAITRVCRNVKRWRNAAMALRWTAAGMMEAAKGFRRLKAYKHPPVLRAALAAHQSKYVIQRVEHDTDAA